MHPSTWHTNPASSRFECVHRVFEKQAEGSPEAIAIEIGAIEAGASAGGEDTWTYSKLDRYANRIANRLLNAGVRRGSLVGSCLRRSPQAIAAMLGILKAGAAYVPFDLSYPSDRLRFMLEDTGLRWMVADEAGILKLGGMQGSRCSLLDVFKMGGESIVAPQVLCDCSDLAYVMYTSGSTGSPKGVMVEHRGITRLVSNPNYASFSADDVLLQLSPLSFDAATFEIWGALLNGARLVLPSGSTPSLTDIADTLKRCGITTAWLTSGLFNALVDEHPQSLRDLKQLLAGGDVLSVDHVRRALRAMRKGCLINGYGPTENTTFTCCHTIRESDLSAGFIPIGQPVSGTEVYILNRELQPVLSGETGEIVVGGAGLARGYWNRPELSQEKFVPNPYSSDPNARMYRTGDLGRLNDGGEIEFLGRMDSQVKIRGFRVEPGEIEAALDAFDGLTASAVVPKGESADRKYLCCYYVPKTGGEITRGDLSRYLVERLPGYLVPDEFVELGALPLDVNGKVDRRALASASAFSPAVERSVEPVGHVESELLQVWKNLFERTSIGLDDDFFELGGHSLLAARMFSQISKKFGKRIPLSAISQASTVRQLASMLRDDTDSHRPPSTVAFGDTCSHLRLFLFRHPEANVLNYRELALQLAPYSVYGVQPSDLDHKTKLGAPSLEELASKYKAAVRAVQPEGPYYLGGYCAGAQIAYEAAQQFSREGEQVAFLAILDGMAEPDPHELVLEGKLREGLTRWFRGLGWAARQKGFLQGLPAEARQFAGEFRHAKQNQTQQKQTQQTQTQQTQTRVQAQFEKSVAQGFFETAVAHRNAPLQGNAVLFRTGESRAFGSDPALGWGALIAGRVAIEDIPGEHDHILDEPNVRVLAEKLRSALNAVDAASTRRGQQSCQSRACETLSCAHR